MIFKDPCAGVMDRQGAPTGTGYRPPGPVTAYVVSTGGHDNVWWSELEPTQGALSPTVMAAILTQLDDAASDGYSGGLKLRVLYGVNAPAWAKTAFGTAIIETENGTENTCVCYWRPAALAAFDDLTRRLAAELDGHPALRDVAITWDGLQYGEPFIRKINQTVTSTTYTSRVNLWNAFVTHVNDTGLVDSQGRRYYTSGASSEPYHGSQLNRAYGTSWFRADRHYGFVFCDRAALRASVATHNRWWLRTRSSLAVNPYQEIVRGDDTVIYGTVEACHTDRQTPRRSWTLAAQREFRELMTQRLVLGNNSVRYVAVEAAAAQHDTFARADNSWGSGWGTADSGGTYTGAATERRVQSGRGEFRQTAVATEQRVRHTNSRSGSSRLDMQLSWTVDAAGAAAWFAAELNIQDVSGTNDGYYQLRIEQVTSGVVAAKLMKQDSTVGSATQLAAHTVGAVTAGTALRVLFEAEGLSDAMVQLRVKVWPAASPEPAAWQIDQADVTPNLANWVGHIGWRTRANAGYTATSNVWQLEAWTLTAIGTPPPGGHVGGPNASARYDAIYQDQAELTGPRYYQTSTMSRLPAANWEDILEWCATPTDALTSHGQHGQGASYVELPPGYDGRGGETPWPTG